MQAFNEIVEIFVVEKHFIRIHIANVQLSIMNSHFSGCKLGISRSSLNICAVLVILLINVHTNLARIYPRPPIDGDELVWVAMVRESSATNNLGNH